MQKCTKNKVKRQTGRNISQPAGIYFPNKLKGKKKKSVGKKNLFSDVNSDLKQDSVFRMEGT